MVQIFVGKKKKKTCVLIFYMFFFFFWESNLYVDKLFWKLRGKWSNFVGNVLVGFRVIFLPDCSLILSLLKHRGVWVFLNQKNEDPKQKKPPNLIFMIYYYNICTRKIR